MSVLRGDRGGTFDSDQELYIPRLPLIPRTPTFNYFNLAPAVSSQEIRSSPTMSSDKNIVKYGYTPVPRDPDVLFKDHPTASGLNPKQADFDLSELPFPESDLVSRSKAFVQKELNTPTFNHSHRVYIYGAHPFFDCFRRPTDVPTVQAPPSFGLISLNGSTTRRRTTSVASSMILAPPTATSLRRRCRSNSKAALLRGSLYWNMAVKRTWPMRSVRLVNRTSHLLTHSEGYQN